VLLITLSTKNKFGGKTMKKTIVTIFLIMLGSIAIFAQKGDSDYRKGKGEDYGSDIERQCYNSTSSFAGFKRCVENQWLPICPRGWDKEIIRDYRDFPCRYETDDYWKKGRPEPIERREPLFYADKDKKEIIYSRQLPNEMPEIFNLR
jgi:hypothetical protein